VCCRVCACCRLRRRPVLARLALVLVLPLVPVLVRVYVLPCVCACVCMCAAPVWDGGRRWLADAGAGGFARRTGDSGGRWLLLPVLLLLLLLDLLVLVLLLGGHGECMECKAAEALRD
jgi:hypothetical protein